MENEWNEQLQDSQGPYNGMSNGGMSCRTIARQLGCRQGPYNGMSNDGMSRRTIARQLGCRQGPYKVRKT